jgi:hypothetical protein
MSTFAGTNWLEAIFLEPDPKGRESVARSATVERRMKLQSGMRMTCGVCCPPGNPTNLLAEALAATPCASVEDFVPSRFL